MPCMKGLSYISGGRPMNRIAILEMGSHTFRSLVCDIDDSSFKVLKRGRAYVGLAREVNQDKYLSEKGILKALQTIKELLWDIEPLKPEERILVATGVLRETQNSEDLFGRISREFGLYPKLLEGQKEAELSFLGATYSLRISGDVAVFDIGGGSTEFGIKVKEGLFLYSTPIGCLRLSKKFPGCWTKKEVWEEMRKHIGEVLKVNLPPLNVDEKLCLVGTGGTMVSLAAMSKGIRLSDVRPESISGTVLSKAVLLRLLELLFSMDLDERAKLPGLDSERAGPIMPGIGILLETMNYFKKESCMVSFEDLLEGVAIEYLRQGVRHGTL